MRIAIIEDDPIDRELYDIAIERLNQQLDKKIEVKYIKNLTLLNEFVARKGDYNFEHIVIDLIIDGTKTLKAIKKISQIYPDAFILSMSSSAHEDDIIAVYENGASDFCMKPHSVSHLVKILQRLVLH